MCMFVYLVSREKAFVNSAKETGYVVKWGLLTLIVPAMGFIAQIYSIIAGKTDFEEIRKTWYRYCYRSMI